MPITAFRAIFDGSVGTPTRSHGSGGSGCRVGIGEGGSRGTASPMSSTGFHCHHLGSSIATPQCAKLSREEPDAGNPRVRVCEGWGWQHPHLLGHTWLHPQPPHRSHTSGNLHSDGTPSANAPNFGEELRIRHTFNRNCRRNAGTPEETSDYLRVKAERWNKVVRIANVKLQKVAGPRTEFQ